MCFHGNCVSFFSQDIGTDVSEAIINYGETVGRFICSSLQTFKFEGSSFCVKEFVSEQDFTQPMQLGQSCAVDLEIDIPGYKIQTTATYNPICGLSSKGNAFCQAQIGDSAIQSVVSQVKSAMGSVD